MKSQLARSAGSLLIALAGLWIAAAATAANPTWLGRPMVRLLAEGDPIPGVPGATFRNFKYFTLRDGTLDVVGGPDGATHGLFRWKNGTLEKVLYRGTPVPGGTIDTVQFVTEETEGALNFAALVNGGGPFSEPAFFELRGTTITRLFDANTPVDGITLGALAYPVRAGHQVVGNSAFTEGGVLKNGILKWDGAHLTKVIASGDDLPGALGAFTGQPGYFQIDFDGVDVAFVATDHPQGRGTNGVYRTFNGGPLQKLVDGTDLLRGRTYHSRFSDFPSVAIDGTNSVVMRTGAFVTRAGNNRYHASLTMSWAGFSGGVWDPPLGLLGLGDPIPFEGFDGTLDGQPVTTPEWVDGHGDDVAYLMWINGSPAHYAIYGVIGGGVTPPPAPVLTAPSVADGNVSFRFPTTAGTNYRVEFQGTLGGAWTLRQTLAGTGSDLTFSEPVAAGGFFRVVVQD